MKTKSILILTVIFSIILCSNAFCMTNKMQSFIEDDRFKDGISWDNSKKVQYGNWIGTKLNLAFGIILKMIELQLKKLGS